MKIIIATALLLLGLGMVTAFPFPLPRPADRSLQGAALTGNYAELVRRTRASSDTAKEDLDGAESGIFTYPYLGYYPYLYGYPRVLYL